MFEYIVLSLDFAILSYCSSCAPVFEFWTDAGLEVCLEPLYSGLIILTSVLGKKYKLEFGDVMIQI